MSKLTAKQERFVAEYLANGLNATNAAVAAGYAEKSARVEGSRLLTNANVAAAIANRTQKAVARLEAKTDYSIDRTLEYVARMAFYDPADVFEADGSLKKIHEIPEQARAVIAGLEVTEIFDGDGEQKHALGLRDKVKLADRRGALDMLMRYHSLYKDKVEVEVIKRVVSDL